MAEELTKEEMQEKKSEQNDKRKKLFFSAIDEVNKRFTKRGELDKAISLLTDTDTEVERFSSGSLALDSVIGGGFPEGRIIEIFGGESSGKTSIALTSIANVQRQGGNCVFIDAEQAFDPKYAMALGVNEKELAISQINAAEDVFQLIVDIVRTGAIDLIVVDSVASLVPKQEEEAGIEKQQMALLARIMSKGLRAIIKPCNDYNCSVIFLNQTREKVGMVFGNPESTPGGKALKFYASQRIKIQKTKAVQGDDGEAIGTEVKFKCVKNKVSKPFGEGLTVLTFAKGINRPAELKELSEKLDVLIKKGHSYFIRHSEPIEGFEGPDEDGLIKVGVYAKGIMTTLKENKEVYEILSKQMVEALEKKNENPDFSEED